MWPEVVFRFELREGLIAPLCVLSGWPCPAELRRDFDDSIRFHETPPLSSSLPVDFFRPDKAGRFKRRDGLSDVWDDDLRDLGEWPEEVAGFSCASDAPRGFEVLTLFHETVPS